MKSLINLLFAFLLTNTIFSQSQDFGTISYSKAVNVSGKQRMLSQKMAKSYLLIAKGVSNDEIKNELTSSIFIFQKQLEIIKDNAQSPVVKLRVKAVEDLWSNYKKLLESNPIIYNCRDVIKQSAEVLRVSHDLVLAIESRSNYSAAFFKDSNQELVKTINISGKQRMLSQKMCLYYSACSIFTTDKKEFKEVLSKTFDEFSEAIGFLLINSYNSSEIDKEIGLVMSEWDFYKKNKQDFINGTFELSEIYKLTNKLTTKFNEITGLYEREDL
jgi:hypothetical protein